MWFEEQLYAQVLPEDLASILNNAGWEQFLKYRYVFKKRKSEKNKGDICADVRLFRSVGTDRKRRNLGIAFGYDTGNSIFSDGRIISEGSPLGFLGVGDGEKFEFRTPISPIDPDNIEVFVDGTQVSSKRYDVREYDGAIIFKVAPNEGTHITSHYKLDVSAPEPPSYLTFFTFSSVNLSRLIGAEAPKVIGDGDGVKKEFYLPAKPVKYNTLILYDNAEVVPAEDYDIDHTNGIITFKEAPSLGAELTARYVAVESGTTRSDAGDGDGEEVTFYTPNAPIATTGVKVYLNGEFVDPEEYKVDYDEGSVEFNTPPKLGVEVTIEYIDLTGGYPGGVTEITNDVTALDEFKVEKPEDLMDAVYRSLDYVTPSLPTVIDFTSEDRFGKGWQRDSYIHVWGNINRDRCVMFTRPDPAGNPETALFSPIYFGSLQSGYVNKPRNNMIIAGGASKLREIVYKPGKKLGDVSVDYGEFTSNGNRGVLLSQAHGGSYYQKHYLQFITHSKYADSGEGKFFPSAYSEKYHLSPIKIVHPNDGAVGYLDDVVAVLPKAIYSGDELEAEGSSFGETIGFGDGIGRTYKLRYPAYQNTIDKVEVDCEVVDNYEYDPATKTITFDTPPKSGVEIIANYTYSIEYQFDLPTAEISAFTLEDYTPYAPIGLGILKNPQKDKKELPELEDDDTPSESENENEDNGETNDGQ